MSDKEIYQVKYPFILVDADYDQSQKIWRPGTRFWTEMYSDYEGETFNECDSEGLMILTVIGKFKPEGYQERIFYKRHWQYPDGEIKGLQSTLNICTAKVFEKLKKGYRFEYEINTSEYKNGRCK